MDEVIYPATIDPIKLIELIDCLDDGLVRAITKEYDALHKITKCLYKPETIVKKSIWRIETIACFACESDDVINKLEKRKRK